MTVESFTPHQPQIIQGVGPYSTSWPALDSGDVAVLIYPAGGGAFILSGSDYSVNLSASGVDVQLSAGIATEYAGALLWIDRATVIEQGWQALANAREKGLEAQLDRLTKAVQEARSGVARSLRFDQDVLPVQAEAGRTIIFDENGQPVPGPSAAQIKDAEWNADLSRRYATEDEDVEVQDDEFSSKHYALKSKAFAEAAAFERQNQLWLISSDEISITIGIAQAAVIQDPGPGPYDTVTLEVA